ncbi:hypothetical protein Mal65_53340 [Crateriforma conspicua]|nr:hypothetical protein Mal65_53340 [Crateriforma conspicua]
MDASARGTEAATDKIRLTASQVDAVARLLLSATTEANKKTAPGNEPDAVSCFCTGGATPVARKTQSRRTGSELLHSTD